SATEADDSPGIAHAKSEQDKKHKNTAHSEIHFQDANCNFVCRIYFAKEFDLLRCQILKHPPATVTAHRVSCGNTSTAGTTGTASGSGGNGCNVTGTETSETSQETMEVVRKMFARSLSKSVRWEARGGKSGSKFSKTVDDRFVLKEMSRTDLTIFENFAPNYFEYLQRCMRLKHITLLAKIFGVFKITIKRKEYVVPSIAK
uniref:PIPK domain-containing protein n=1 Tax=Anopheles maculatus TaxID=74869 RepID=A0A182T5P0_9DIPT